MPRRAKEVPQGTGLDLLRAELEKRGWTQGRLARELGVDSGVVNRWVKGTRTPDLTGAVALQKKLGIPVVAWVEPDAA